MRAMVKNTTTDQNVAKRPPSGETSAGGGSGLTYLKLNTTRCRRGQPRRKAGRTEWRRAGHAIRGERLDPGPRGMPLRNASAATCAKRCPGGRMQRHACRAAAQAEACPRNA